MFLEVLKYIFSNFWIWLGTAILLSIACIVNHPDINSDAFERELYYYKHKKEEERDPNLEYGNYEVIKIKIPGAPMKGIINKG